ncbi:MAG: DUF488 domain-containing protein [Bacteroidia bacterium]|nr:DUF488 domain-containing protein [Bacteroidia bacterium]
MHNIKIKRIYDNPEVDDGYRILVDRLWPRGVTKERAHINEWNKEVAPSNDLRKWFAHKPENFIAFSSLYKRELQSKKEILKQINAIKKEQNITLLYAAKDPKINHAIVLATVLNTLK